MIRAGAVVRFVCRRPRRVRRALAWLTLAAAAPALWACADRTLEAPVIVAQHSEKGRITLSVNRNVDLLFLVDNSKSMKDSQDNLLRNFPTFMTALKELPGGLPNVHIAVVSSDMGAGDGSLGGCGAGGTGDRGVFRSGPGVSCTATNLDPGATFISDIGGVGNYSGDLEDVFTCIAELGEAGCGFEHQFASITRALGADGQPPPAENQGFLRADAYLAIIMITNEDDCSAPADSLLFDITANRTLADQLGPATNFRCNEFGHVCDGARPNRLAPGNDETATQSYAQCVSAEDGILLTVADTAARIKALKPNETDKILVAAITGPQTPYTVHWEKPLNADTGPHPEISHACTAPDTSYADPSPRVTQFVNEFGLNGLLLSICGGEFSGALSSIAEKIAAKLTPPCIDGRIAKRRGTDRDDCTVVSSVPGASGTPVETAIADCADTNGAGPCWRLVAGTGTCAGQTVEVVPGPSGPSVSGETAAVECSVCAQGSPDPGRGCP